MEQLRLRGLKTRGGSTVRAQHVHKFLRNRVYTGVVVCESWGGVEYRGDFPPLVSEEVFQRVQLVFRSATEMPGGRRLRHQDFPLGRFVRCGQCKAPFTGSWSRGKLGQRYAYYNCRRHCAGQSMSKTGLEAAFIEVTRALVPSSGYLRVLRKLVLNAWADERDDLERRRHAQQTRLDALRRKLTVLDQRFIYEGAIDRESYTRERDRLREDLLLAEMDLADAQVDMIDVESVLASAEDILSNASTLWREGSLDQRERLQGCSFQRV